MQRLAKRLRKPTVFISLLITLVFAVLTVINPSIIDEHIETLLVDYRFKIRNLISAPQVPQDILTVNIDEKSLSMFGRWPWDRRLQAELIEKVFEGKPKVVAVDIFYPEPESPGSDRALAESVKKHTDVVVFVVGLAVEHGKGADGDWMSGV